MRIGPVTTLVALTTFHGMQGVNMRFASIGALAFSVFCSVSVAQEPDVKALAEKNIREHVAPNIIKNSRGRAASSEKDYQDRMDELIQSAKDAKILNKREVKVVEANPGEYRGWKFKSTLEKERKVKELEIRKLLGEPAGGRGEAPDGFHPLEVSGRFRHLYFSRLPDDWVVMVSTRHSEKIELTERVSDDVLHVNCRVTDKDPSQRFALHGLPKDLAESMEVGRNVVFYVLIHGTEKYESVTGERTLISLYYVDPKWANDRLDAVLDELNPEKPAKPKSLKRNWTSMDGKFKVEATPGTVTDDSVELVKDDGNKITVPLAKLSRNDAEWARAYKAAQGPLETVSQGDDF